LIPIPEELNEPSGVASFGNQDARTLVKKRRTEVVNEETTQLAVPVSLN
jgi:hypothetical protein